MGEIDCYMTRVRPHIISKKIGDEIDERLAFVRREIVRGRPRIPFECPPDFFA